MQSWLLDSMELPYMNIRRIPSQDTVDWWLVEQANPSFCRWIGSLEMDLLGKDVRDILPVLASHLEQLDISGARVASAGELPEGIRYLREADRIHLLWPPVSELKEETLVRREDLKYRLAKTQEIAGVADWHYHVGTRELYWSDALYQMMGVEPGAFSPSFETFNSYVYPEDLERIRALNIRTFSGREYRSQFRICPKGHGVRWLHSTVQIKRDHWGNPLEAYGLVKDITETRLIEDDLRKAIDEAERANIRKSTYLANMSHEIRIPLTGITGMTDLLLKTKLSEDQNELAGYIKQSGDAVIQMINDILDYSKMESGKMTLDKKSFDLKQVIQSVGITFDSWAKGKGLAFSVRVDSTVPTRIYADGLRIRQIMNNLISNAVKFTIEGAITVRISAENSLSAAPMLRLEVQDTGIGIPIERQPIIFEAYEQGSSDTAEKFGGSGLGLAICKRLVDLMGGTIDLTSRHGAGTRITCLIPFEPAKDMPVENAPKPLRNPISLTGMKILLAEDNFINRLFLTKLLEEVHHCKIRAVDNGLEALDAIKNNRYDCVLMDGNLPGMTGIDVVGTVRRSERGRGIFHDMPEYTPIVALTAEVRPGDESRYLNAGMDYYLKKPIQEDALVAVLAKLKTRKGAVTIPPMEDLWRDKIQTIDRSVFEVFSEHLTPEEVLSVLNMALKEYPLKELEAALALEQGEILRFKGYIHTLRGSSGYFGSKQLETFLADFEAVEDMDMESLQEQYRRFKIDLYTFIGELQMLADYYSALV